MKKPLIIVSSLIVAAALFWAGAFYWRNLRGLGPALKSPPQDIARLLTPEANGADQSPRRVKFPLKLPPGFSIAIFAQGLGNPRVLLQDPGGTLIASIPGQGRVVALPDKNQDGIADKVIIVARGLQRPHGMIFRREDGKTRLYIAEVEQLAVYDYDGRNFKASGKKKILDLPGAGRHWTRTMAFLPDGRLLISVGSSCDTCLEKDWRHAKVLVANPDGSNLKVFASGLRNAVFMALHPLTKQVWVTEMGRDFLGDNLPPDEINILAEGKDYGWPYCYGNRVHDSQFDPQGTKKAFCKQTVPAYIDLPAHSAPLGLAFFPETGWPQDYRHNLLVAFHGSWNRSVPTGYKVVRIKLDDKGNYLGTEDFITGWLTPKGALGRPADILIKNNGEMYISDDKAGVVYRVVFTKK
ncbi:MAG: PQQ-dependent sugar dehydrogenase [Syntrophales bacterium]|nr:PQQ-dependent sugar dehydrogenase [Syntrophales bacterium]